LHSDINITEQDIQDQFDILNRNKPAGPDGILPKIIKKHFIFSNISTKTFI